MFAGKEVHPVLRYRDTDGNLFSQTTHTSGQRQTESIYTAASSAPGNVLDAESAQTDSTYESSSSALESGASNYESDSDSEQEVASHLHRLQSLAGNWRVKQQIKRARTATKASEQESEEGASDDGLQGKDSFSLPPVPAMQVYLHGIDEAVLQASLTSSSLWDRIQLRDSLQVNSAYACYHMYVFIHQ